MSPTRLHFRQVADPANPAYFLRSTSAVYGLSEGSVDGERVYQETIAKLSAVDFDLPHRLQHM